MELPSRKFRTCIYGEFQYQSEKEAIGFSSQVNNNNNDDITDWLWEYKISTVRRVNEAAFMWEEEAARISPSYGIK